MSVKTVSIYIHTMPVNQAGRKRACYGGRADHVSCRSIAGPCFHVNAWPLLPSSMVSNGRGSRAGLSESLLVLLRGAGEEDGWSDGEAGQWELSTKNCPCLFHPRLLFSSKRAFVPPLLLHCSLLFFLLQLGRPEIGIAISPPSSFSQGGILVGQVPRVYGALPAGC